MKKKIAVFLALVLLVSFMAVGLSGCGNRGEYINVYNWGEYIDEELIDKFEEETGITVNYITSATCEEMYAKVKNGGVAFDLVVPSDYMVSRMIEEGMLEPLDYSNIPNAKYVDENFLNPVYDPTGEYSMPYQWGTVGVIYNKDMVDESDIGSWDILWNEKYENQILMFDNSRDAMGIALKSLGHSYNIEDPDVLRKAADLLIEQKPLVQAYVMDQIFDKMESGEAAVAPYYTGDYYLMIDEISEGEAPLGYFVPEEGSNMYVDAMCVPQGAQNKAGAEAFINFMLEPENMAQNTEWVCYSTAESAARDLLPENMKTNTDMYPTVEKLAEFETYLNLKKDIRKLYDTLWIEIMSS